MGYDVMSRCAVECDVFFCNKKKTITALTECDGCKNNGYANIDVCRNRNLIKLPKDDIENE